MQRKILITAAVMGVLSVIIGAWAAHGIQGVILDSDPDKMSKIDSFKVGVRYQFYHTFLLLFLSLIPIERFSSLLSIVYRLVVIGVVLFSGSIYALALKSQLGLEGATKFLGPITPIGGLTLIVAWSILVFYGLKHKKI